MKMPSINSSNNLSISPVDALELSAFMSQEGLRANYRPSMGSGSIKLGMSFHRLPEFTFWENMYSSDVTGALEADDTKVVILLPIEGNIRIQTRSGYVSSSSSTGFIGNSSEYKQVELYCGLHQRLISLSKVKLLQTISSYIGEPVSSALNFKHDIDMNLGAGRLLNAFALIFHDGLVASATMKNASLLRANLSDALANLVTMSLPHSLSYLYNRPLKNGSTTQLRRAIDFIQGNAQLPLTVADIAAACGLSVPSLYNLFREHQNTTPKAFVRHARLEAARSEILASASTTSIGQVARKWGFINLGDFAAHYQKTFGELPRDTTKNSRGKKHDGNAKAGASNEVI